MDIIYYEIDYELAFREITKFIICSHCTMTKNDKDDFIFKMRRVSRTFRSLTSFNLMAYMKKKYEITKQLYIKQSDILFKKSLEIFSKKIQKKPSLILNKNEYKNILYYRTHIYSYNVEINDYEKELEITVPDSDDDVDEILMEYIPSMESNGYDSECKCVWLKLHDGSTTTDSDSSDK